MLIKLLKKIKLFDQKKDLDGKYWVQKLLLKKSLNSMKY
tara:strand:- start:1158 stop:1274 length:117 start_codon:yes stop_codon:yes gene_type:complete